MWKTHTRMHRPCMCARSPALLPVTNTKCRNPGCLPLMVLFIAEDLVNAADKSMQQGTAAYNLRVGPSFDAEQQDNIHFIIPFTCHTHTANDSNAQAIRSTKHALRKMCENSAIHRITVTNARQAAEDKQRTRVPQQQHVSYQGQPSQ